MKLFLAVLSAGILSAFVVFNSAHAEIISVDDFSGGSNLGGNGISANSSNNFATSVTDSPLDVLGGFRVTTLTNISRTGDVTLAIDGDSGHLHYISSNGANAAAGSFDLLYNGPSGFPASFSSDEFIQIDVKNQTNPGAHTDFSITLTAGNGDSYTSPVQPLDGHSDGATLIFAFDIVPFAILGSVTSIILHAESSPGSNFILSGLKLDPPGDGGGGSNGGVVPEPQSLLLWVVVGLGLTAYALLRPMFQLAARLHP